LKRTTKRVFKTAGIFKKALPCLFIFCAAALAALDFGAVVNAEFYLEDYGGADPYGKIIVGPWISFPLGEADLYLSAGVHADYFDKMLFIPDIFHLEFSFKPHPSLSVRLGRIAWQDTTRFTAKGAFDGADALWDLGKVRLGAAVLYTGLLYQGAAEINMSPGDPNEANYAANLDWHDFADTYFAPRRIITSLYAQAPAFLLPRGNFYAGLLAQFDLSDTAEKYHTQYLLLRYSFAYKQFDLAAAGALELENTTAGGVKVAYAFTVEGGWQPQLPFVLKDRLSLSLYYASGQGDYSAAFFPLVGEAQGLALKPHFSGLMIIRANYEARFLPSLSAELGLRYFIRNDSIKFTDPYKDPYLNDESYFIGAEIDATLLWIPFSDLSFSLSGGLFLPQTGGAFRSGAPVIWSLCLGTIFSF
jgi:hypothetical protein